MTSQREACGETKRTDLPFLMIYHNIMRFDISVHNALAMAEV